MRNDTADLICEILTLIYVDALVPFASEAAARRITLEQLAAAAITKGVFERSRNQRLIQTLPAQFLEAEGRAFGEG